QATRPTGARDRPAPGAARARRGTDRTPKKSCAAPGQPAAERRDQMMRTVTEMAPRLGVARTCAALGLPRASYYRGQQPRSAPKPRPAPVRALPPEEREQVLAALHVSTGTEMSPRSEEHTSELQSRRDLVCRL